MKLETLIDAARCMRAIGMDLTDILVLGEVLRRHGQERGPVPTMEILTASDIASPVSIHKRIKKLCDAKVLTKVAHSTNQRYRVIDFGPKYARLVSRVQEFSESA